MLVVGLVLAAVGVGTLLAALNVAYRDFRYVIPFLVQLWMFATPTVYMQPERMLSPAWRAFLPLNPAYGLIANFRAAVMGGPLDPYALAVSLAVSASLFVAGGALLPPRRAQLRRHHLTITSHEQAQNRHRRCGLLGSEPHPQFLGLPAD